MWYTTFPNDKQIHLYQSVSSVYDLLMQSLQKVYDTDWNRILEPQQYKPLKKVWLPHKVSLQTLLVDIWPYQAWNDLEYKTLHLLKEVHVWYGVCTNKPHTFCIVHESVHTCEKVQHEIKRKKNYDHVEHMIKLRHFFLCSLNKKT